MHGKAWALSTGAAVTLSWWSVHTVLSGTAYDPPRALPIADAARTADEEAKPQPYFTYRPEKSPGPSESPPGSDGGGKDDTVRRPSACAPRSSAPTSLPSPSGKPSGGAVNVKGYTVDGGRVVFGIKRSSADLVSATPESGWQMQVWKTPQWIRVAFTRDDREISVFCTWYQHAPLVEIEER
ncbi:hypothetical protein OG520_36850 [Streptomyces sp. NBC_00984]|uniref:hypothetical protein n=1 Tax=Streptomyces sp. NBC_00984 TaxID=2903700 RepID=UPI0038639C65|nr:hypothetical protein OG520_36850 [Streptomyces sp. NBC_00984]